MKKLILIILLTAVLLIACNNEKEKNITLEQDLLSVQAKLSELTMEKDGQILSLTNDINTLTDKLDKKIAEVNILERQLAVGTGYAVNYMNDLEVLYDELKLPMFIVGDASDVAHDLIEALEKDPIYSDKRVVSMIIYDNGLNREDKYTMMCLMFTPVSIEVLEEKIKDASAPPFGSVRLYSITVDTSNDMFSYDVN